MRKPRPAPTGVGGKTCCSWMRGKIERPRLLPRGLGPHDTRLVAVHRLLAGIRAGGATLCDLPGRRGVQWHVREERKNETGSFLVHRTVAGAAQSGDHRVPLASRLTVPE